ncbi:helix-turn-helix domain-containing protein [Kitasatospora sp. NPDC056446]|uniref:helix-turn-helix domain-containing protein n=1 Tax=Kitasatospora sp. NPDC056446 TaxID=3345819 RepID=UPI00369BF027
MSGQEHAGPGPSASRILSEDARKLYLQAVNETGRLTQDAVSAAGSLALEELLDLGLLIPDSEEPGALLAADPAQLASSLSSAWQRQALDLLSKAVSLPADLNELSEAFHAPDTTGGSVEYVHGKALINQRLQQSAAPGVMEGLSMQPGGPRPAEMLTSFLERDLEILRHGASMRTIYHASTRYHQPTRDYVAQLTAEGWQFRTLDEPYARLIIVDRRVAVIPVASDYSQAAFIHDPAVISFLIEEVFERSWGRALEFDGNRAVPHQVVSRLRQTIIDLMLSGTNHRAIARRLGISERTLARHIAEMREEYNVDSLFQLGYVLGRSPKAEVD